MQKIHISVEEMVQDGREKCIIDLRKPEDYGRGSYSGAINIYWKEFARKISELPKGKPLYLICYTGETSDDIAEDLRKKGFEVYSVQEGYRGYLRWKLRQAMK